MNIKNKSKILVVCHDAGGAEIVSAYVKKNINKCDFFCLAKGPAIKIFKRKKLDKCLISSTKKRRADILITGTSGNSNIEIDFIKKTKQQGTKTISYLDHWRNYRERFGYPKKNWRNNLPNEIWTGDKYAHTLAKKFFKKIPCKLIPNLYFREIKKEYKKIRNKNKGNNILFISEPMDTNNVYPFNEFEILEKLLKYFTAKKIKNKIIVCYHPSEKKNKYDSLISKYSNALNIKKGGDNKLKELTSAKLVIGIMSMMLVIAKLCGKKAISFIPDSKTKCPIPLDGIIKIKKTKELNKIIKTITSNV